MLGATGLATRLKAARLRVFLLHWARDLAGWPGTNGGHFKMERKKRQITKKQPLLPPDLAKAYGASINKALEESAAQGKLAREEIKRLIGVDVRTDVEASDLLAAEYGWEFARDYDGIPDWEILARLLAAARRRAAEREHQKLQEQPEASPAPPATPQQKPAHAGEPPRAERHGPFDIQLNENSHVALRGNRKCDFGSRELEWSLFLELCERYPEYYKTTDLASAAWKRNGDDVKPDAGAFRFQLTGLNRRLKQLGIRVKCKRHIGYKLEAPEKW
jgi:hypothetical protein